MKKTILFLLFFAPTLIFGQAKIGFHGGTIFSGLTNNFSVLKDAKVPHLGLQFGGNVLIPIKSQRFYGISGIEFTAYSQKFDLSKLRWGSQHNGQGGFDPNLSSGEDIISISHVFYIEVPIGARYYLNEKKWSVYIQSSIDAAIYLTNRNKIDFSGDSNSIRWNLSPDGRTFNYTGNLGFGIEGKLNEKMSIFFQPNAEMQLLSFTNDSVTGSKFYAYGIKAGMSFGL